MRMEIMVSTFCQDYEDYDYEIASFSDIYQTMWDLDLIYLCIPL